jgi:hypothetical protein
VSSGLGGVFVAITTAANAGVSIDQAGLAPPRFSLPSGSARSPRDPSAITTSRTNHMLDRAPAANAPPPGYRALLATAAPSSWSRRGIVALRTSSTRGGIGTQRGARLEPLAAAA